MTIVALKPEHFDILENESVSAWLTFSGAIAPGTPIEIHFYIALIVFLTFHSRLGHGMANWRLKTGSAVEAALQNLSSILSDPSSFTLSPEQLLALTSPEDQPRQRDEFDFSDDDAVLAPSPAHREKRKKKRKSDDGRVERRGRVTEYRRRSELGSEDERLPQAAADSDDEPVVSRLEEPAAASPATSTSPPREQMRRKRVVTAAGGSDSEDESGLDTKQRSEPTPVTEVRKRRPVVLSDDDE